MAKAISAEGIEKVLDLKKGALMGLEYMQKAVGGYIECVNLPEGSEYDTMVCDEDGISKGLTPNVKAARLTGWMIDEKVCTLSDMEIVHAIRIKRKVPEGMQGIIWGDVLLCNTNFETGDMVA